MNDERKKRVEAVLEKLKEAQTALFFIQDEELCSFELLLKHKAFVTKCTKVGENVASLEDAYSSLEDVLDNLATILED